MKRKSNLRDDGYQAEFLGGRHYFVLFMLLVLLGGLVGRALVCGRLPTPKVGELGPLLAHIPHAQGLLPHLCLSITHWDEAEVR